MNRAPIPQQPMVTLDADEVLRIAAYPKRSFSLEADVIAYAYHQLALALAQKLGYRDANWFCFATWVSKAVGESLNLGRASPFWGHLAERLNVPRPLRRGFRRVMIILLGGSYLKGLSLANRSIFLEMGSFAADLWSPQPRAGYEVKPHERPARQFISSLLAEANPEYLVTAMRLLREAESVDDDTLRSELILGANVAMTAYEQARAQKVLEFVVYRSVRWLLRVSWRSVLHWLTPWRPFHRFALYAEPHSQQSWPVRGLEDWWARNYTRHVLALETPIGEVHVGAPLHRPSDFDPQAVPPPFRNEQVRRLMDEFAGPLSADTCIGTKNWLCYEERMRFIACYFRLYQHVHALFDPPYEPSAAQHLLDELDEGELPTPVPPERGPQESGAELVVNGGPSPTPRPRPLRLFPLPRRVDPEARDLDAVRLERNIEPRAADEAPTKL
jgi:hypothetical protein